MGVQSDDKVLKTTDCFLNKEIVVLEKLDGENTTAYNNHFHARSIDSKHNFTRDWFAKMHSVLRHDIPTNMRFVFENMFAEHSIRYENLNSYAYLLSIWEDRDNGDYCLSYDATREYAEILDLCMPTELYRGVFDVNTLVDIANSIDTNVIEGYVIRVTDEFEYSQMQQSVSKFVRKNHVQTDAKHWLKTAKQNGTLVGNIKPQYMG
jgi:hypothetical protein